MACFKVPPKVSPKRAKRHVAEKEPIAKVPDYVAEIKKQVADKEVVRRPFGERKRRRIA